MAELPKGYVRWQFHTDTGQLVTLTVDGTLFGTERVRITVESSDGAKK